MINFPKMWRRSFWVIYITIFSFSLYAQLRLGVKFYPKFSAESLFSEEKVYSVFIIEFLNDGKQPVKIGENFVLITDRGVKYHPRPAPWLKKEIRDRFGIKEKMIWIGKLKPGQSATKIVVFNPIPDDCQKVKLMIYGLRPKKPLSITFVKKGEEWKESERKWEK